MTDPDWSGLAQLVIANEAAAFSIAILKWLSSPGTNFKIVQKGLREHVFFTVVDAPTSLHFILSCLEDVLLTCPSTPDLQPLQPHAGDKRSLPASSAAADGAADSAHGDVNVIGDDPSPGNVCTAGSSDVSPAGNNRPTVATQGMLSSLMLELVPSNVPDEPLRLVAPRAAALFEAALQAEETRLRVGVKLATVFRLRREDLQDYTALVTTVQALVAARSSFGAAVSLLMHFQDLNAHVDKEALLGGMLEAGQETLAEKFVAQLGRADQVVFVEQCVAQDRLRPALKAVRAFGLAEDFPDVEAAYKQQGVARLVERQQWGVAISFVGNDRALQEMLLAQMVTFGEKALALEACRQFGLPESTLAVDAAALAAEVQQRAEKYLGLALPMASVVFVNTSDLLATAAAALAAAPLVGIDVEWKPSHTAGGSSPASILQVGARESVFIFDLLVLAAEDPAGLDACLQPLMASSTVKLGFELSGDLSKLSTSYRSLRCFQHVRNVFDVKELWMAHALATKIGQAKAAGLSTLCSTVLGKPLDKAMQVSNWEARPLSERQLLYAAQDAHVLLLLHDRLLQLLPPGEGERLLAARCTTYAATQGPPKKANRDDGGGGEGGSVSGTLGAGAAGGQAVLSTSEPPLRSSTCAARAILPQAPSHSLAAPSCGHDRRASQAVLAGLTAAGLSSAYRMLQLQGGSLATAASAADALGVPASHIAKSVALLVSRPGSGTASQPTPLLAVVRGDRRLDMSKVCRHTQVSRRSIRIADAHECLSIFGYPAGTLPPFAHPTAIPVLVDCGLRALPPAAPSAALPPPAAAGALDTAAAAMRPGVNLGAAPFTAETTVEPSSAAALHDGVSLQPLTSQCADDAQGVEALRDGVSLNAALATSQTAVGAVDAPLSCNSSGRGTVASPAASAANVAENHPASYIDGGRNPVGGGSVLSSSSERAPVDGHSDAVAGQAAHRDDVVRSAAVVPTAHDVDSVGRRARIVGFTHNVCCDDERSKQSHLGTPAVLADGRVSGSPSSINIFTDICTTGGTDTPSLYCGAGSTDAAVILTFEQLLTLCGGEVVDIVAGLPGETGGDEPSRAAAAAAALPPGYTLTGGKPLSSRPGEVRFLLDSMLGRLCRWLRCLGVDVEIISRPYLQAPPRRAIRMLVPGVFDNGNDSTAAGSPAVTSDGLGASGPQQPDVDGPSDRIESAACDDGGVDVVCATYVRVDPHVECMSGLGATSEVDADLCSVGQPGSITSSAGRMRRTVAEEPSLAPEATPAAGSSHASSCLAARSPPMDDSLSLDGHAASTISMKTDAGPVGAQDGVDVVTLCLEPPSPSQAQQQQPQQQQQQPAGHAFSTWCSYSDAETARLAAHAIASGRVFLTRDLKLASRRDVSGAYVLGGDDPLEQLGEVSHHFGVMFNEKRVMSRCNACNAADFHLIQPREAAQSLVPGHVYQSVEEFWRCGGCAKVFWLGPKSHQALQQVSDTLREARRRLAPYS